MSTKTYHGQTAKFIAVIATSMPKISLDVMQGWIDNPTALRRALDRALCPPDDSPEITPLVGNSPMI